MHCSPKSIVSIISIAILILGASAQPPSSSRVGFYNVQNLFDTINNPSTDDGEFCDSTKYDFERKINSLTDAITLFNADILAICEVENYEVVNELTQSIQLQNQKNYSIIHYDSRDSRGIDLAIIYDKDKFKLLSSEAIELEYLWRGFIRAEFISNQTSQNFVIYTAHLPSKIGGNTAQNKRSKALDTLQKLVIAEESMRVIICGDMNDSPKEHKILENLSLKAFKDGKGSYIYRDIVSMPDQIIITPELKRYLCNDLQVVNSPILLNKSGKFKGYPKRNYPSDHLPIYIDIIL